MIKAHLRIDFVSDVTCPWCAVGLGALEQALERMGDVLSVDIHFQPFELNPQMGPEGQDVEEHLTQKYATSAEQQAQMRDRIRRRGAEVGFVFDPKGRGRIWNTFDAHRLLHLAELEGTPGAPLALKHLLLRACHTYGQEMSDHRVLATCAEKAGLNRENVRSVLGSEKYTSEVRERESYYTDRGIHAVPAVIVGDRHVISGGQPSDVYEQVLRRLASTEQAPSHE